MRFSPRYYGLALSSLVLLPLNAFADVNSIGADVAAARRELAAAKIAARQLSQVEYPRHRQELNAAIEIADAEIRSLRRQVRGYAPFHTFAYGQQPTLYYRDLPVCLKEAEVRYRTLVDERNNLARSYSNELQLLELRVAEARDRVRALEGGGLIEFEPGVVVERASVID